MVEIKAIENVGEKKQIAETVLRALPDWFGMEEPLAAYIEKAGELPVLAAFAEGSPVGFVALEAHNAYTMEIHVMGILTAYHRQGIGRALVARGEALARARGAEFLTVKTLADTHPDEGYRHTRMFYLAMGFRPLEVFPLLWDEWNPCLLMAKYVA